MIPITPATRIPIGIGCSSVALLMMTPSPNINSLIPGPINVPTTDPVMAVTAGVTTTSIGVSLETTFPNSAPITAATKAPTGPPNSYPAKPVITEENKTSGGDFKPRATATAIPGPAICLAIGANVSVK